MAKEGRVSGEMHPTSAIKSHNVQGVNHTETGEDFNGDWPGDGFILPGTATADQGEGRGQFVQGSNGRGNPRKGNRK